MATKKNANNWTRISIHPLSGLLDTRSRPSDIPLGAFRYKQSFLVNSEGKLCRRAGFSKAWGDAANFVNQDHHHQNATREPITFAFESTDQDGFRRLWDGTATRLSVLDEATGLWTDMLTGVGAPGARWHAGETNNQVIFTNNVDPPQRFKYADNLNPATGPAPIPDLTNNVKVTKAKVIASFSNFILIANVYQDGVRYLNRVRWCDVDDPTVWKENPGVNLAGFQDLDNGDEVLAMIPMLGFIYLFTRRSIWKVVVDSGNSQNAFLFTKVYTEPLNQTGCLVYPNSAVSVGTGVYYMSRDGIWYYDPYIPAPIRPDWLHRADGIVFRGATAMTGALCDLPVAEYLSADKELWFSWPSAASDENDTTLVCQTDPQWNTADVVDAGFSILRNFRRNPAAGLCNEVQDFLGASTFDWALKDIGTGFARQYVNMGANVTDDIGLVATYNTVGYVSILRGLIPTGLNDREKICREVSIEDDTSAQLNPCKIRTRIGTSWSLMDPNDTDNNCAPLWTALTDVPLQCSDPKTLTAMKAANQRPTVGKDLPCYQQGRYLFFEFTICGADSVQPVGLSPGTVTPAVGGDSCWASISFDLQACPKP